MKTQLFISFSTFPTSCVRHSRHEADDNRENTTKIQNTLKTFYSLFSFFTCDCWFFSSDSTPHDFRSSTTDERKKTKLIDWLFKKVFCKPSPEKENNYLIINATQPSRAINVEPTESKLNDMASQLIRNDMTGAIMNCAQSKKSWFKALEGNSIVWRCDTWF